MPTAQKARLREMAVAYREAKKVFEAGSQSMDTAKPMIEAHSRFESGLSGPDVALLADLMEQAGW